jgi:hypothetical protein
LFRESLENILTVHPLKNKGFESPKVNKETSCDEENSPKLPFEITKDKFG